MFFKQCNESLDRRFFEIGEIVERVAQVQSFADKMWTGMIRISANLSIYNKECSYHWKELAAMQVFLCSGLIVRALCATRPGFLLLIFTAAVNSSEAYSESNSQLGFNFFPATKIDNPSIDARIISLLNVYDMLKGGEERKYILESDISKINFYFASGEDFIVSERVSLEAISPFQDEAVEQISKLPTNTDTCYVQSFRFDQSHQVTIVIHNEDYDYSEDIYRCLVAGLWRFSFGSFDGFDGIDWRRYFLDLF